MSWPSIRAESNSSMVQIGVQVGQKDRDRKRNRRRWEKKRNHFFTRFLLSGACVAGCTDATQDTLSMTSTMWTLIGCCWCLFPQVIKLHQVRLFCFRCCSSCLSSLCPVHSSKIQSTMTMAMAVGRAKAATTTGDEMDRGPEDPTMVKREKEKTNQLVNKKE